MTAGVRTAGDRLARLLYLNAARDADVPRRHETQQALARWRQASTDADRQLAYRLLCVAAADCGVPAADHPAVPVVAASARPGPARRTP